MKLSEIQDFFADHLRGLGLREHVNGFARNNIPATLLDQSFTLEFRDATVVQGNQIAHVFRVPLTVSIYFKDYKTQSDLRTVATTWAERVLAAVLRPAVNLRPGGFSVQPSGFRIDPVGASNQASGIMTIDFNVQLYLTF